MVSKLQGKTCSCSSNRPIRLTQCCTQFKSLGVKILCVVNLHDNEAFTFKWCGNSWNKTFYSQRIWIGYNIELAELVYWNLKLLQRWTCSENKTWFSFVEVEEKASNLTHWPLKVKRDKFYSVRLTIFWCEWVNLIQSKTMSSSSCRCGNFACSGFMYEKYSLTSCSAG